MMNLWGSTQARGDVESTVMIDGGVKAKKKKNNQICCKGKIEDY